MNTYLFTWNPKKWDWSEQKNLIAQLPTKKPTRKWATVSSKNIGIGDKFILIKIGSIPKSEKGIIGIGSIISQPFKDKDFLKNDNIRNYVTLEFDQLSQIPYICLSDLEINYPNQKWTPEGSGVLIQDKTVCAKIFSRISNHYLPKEEEFSFEKRIFFPIVANEIDEKLTVQYTVHRDDIVQTLLKKYQSNLEKIAKNSNKTSLFIAQNMVDWFSAELTKNSEIVAQWQHKYHRSPIKVNGRKITNYSLATFSPQDEIIFENQIYKEGSVREIKVNAYERNPLARQKCLDHWKYNCQCCGFNFEKIYGEIGKTFIHVHHLKPISEIKEEYVLNPIEDLIPLCANCHAMIHRRTPPYSISEIQEYMKKK